VILYQLRGWWSTAARQSIAGCDATSLGAARHWRLARNSPEPTESALLMGRQFITADRISRERREVGRRWLEILVECLQQQVTPKQARPWLELEGAGEAAARLTYGNRVVDTLLELAGQPLTYG